MIIVQPCCEAFCTCVCVGAEPGGPAGAELCEDAAGGAAAAAGPAGGGEEGSGRTAGAGGDKEQGAGEQRWVEVDVHVNRHAE